MKTNGMKWFVLVFVLLSLNIMDLFKRSQVKAEEYYKNEK